MINNQIFITSVNKAINKSKIYGKLNTRPLALFSIYNYYLNNKDILESIYPDDYIKKIKCIKDILQKLEYTYPDQICNYKIVIPTNSNENLNKDINTPPEIDDKIIVFDTMEYNFTSSDFLTNYYDEQNDDWNKIKIIPNASNINQQGTLYYNNTEVTGELIINVSDATNLTYKRNQPEYSFDDSFNFQVSDVNQNSLFSETQTILIKVEKLYNQPPSIGDISITDDNRVTTILDLDVFTNQMQPPYNDPENDLIDAIRIDSIDSSNQGVFEYDSNTLQVGDIISREDLNADLLTHIGPNTDSIVTDSLMFSARDEGSQQWVQ